VPNWEPLPTDIAQLGVPISGTSLVGYIPDLDQANWWVQSTRVREMRSRWWPHA